MENNNFKKAFLTVDKLYNKEIGRYFALKKKLYTYLKKKGFHIQESKKNLVLKKGRVYKAVNNWLPVHKKFMKELSRPVYKKMIKLLAKVSPKKRAGHKSFTSLSGDRE